MKNLKYFTNSFIVTFIGLILGGILGYYSSNNSIGGMLQGIFAVFILSVLEVSLSFDNAIVNAAVLKDMTPLWRHRFLTWGMLIAVFGMRLVFPLVIVCFAAQVGPIEALTLAISKPNEYAQIMQSAHVGVAAFGGAFLMMVGLKYFFDQEKEIHWIKAIEKPLTKLGKMEAVELAFVILTLYFLSKFLPTEDKLEFMVAGMLGLAVFIFTDGIAAFLEVPKDVQTNLETKSLALFLYLEVLDASFSFDGVVGAFAISNNLFIITIGLGVGAMFVRSLTILLVEKETLSEYRYLEHGAFYAILSLAFIMFLNTIFHISEVVTGLLGAFLIFAALISSIRYNKKHSE